MWLSGEAQKEAGSVRRRGARAGGCRQQETEVGDGALKATVDGTYPRKREMSR